LTGKIRRIPGEFHFFLGSPNRKFGARVFLKGFRVKNEKQKKPVYPAFSI
jgi:hypothetical protein